MSALQQDIWSIPQLRSRSLFALELDAVSAEQAANEFGAQIVAWTDAREQATRKDILASAGRAAVAAAVFAASGGCLLAPVVASLGVAVDDSADRDPAFSSIVKRFENSGLVSHSVECEVDRVFRTLDELKQCGAQLDITGVRRSSPAAGVVHDQTYGAGGGVSVTDAVARIPRASGGASTGRTQGCEEGKKEVRGFSGDATGAALEAAPDVDD